MIRYNHSYTVTNIINNNYFKIIFIHFYNRGLKLTKFEIYL